MTFGSRRGRSELGEAELQRVGDFVDARCGPPGDLHRLAPMRGSRLCRRARYRPAGRAGSSGVPANGVCAAGSVRPAWPSPPSSASRSRPHRRRRRPARVSRSLARPRRVPRAGCRRRRESRGRRRTLCRGRPRADHHEAGAAAGDTWRTYESCEAVMLPISSSPVRGGRARVAVVLLGASVPTAERRIGDGPPVAHGPAATQSGPLRASVKARTRAAGPVNSFGIRGPRLRVATWSAEGAQRSRSPAAAEDHSASGPSWISIVRIAAVHVSSRS